MRSSTTMAMIRTKQSNIPHSTFQTTLLHWFDQHGRKHLPWQQNKTPYRVWISEMMLQQTQVATVIPYFDRFMQTFPTLQRLAKAPEDEVLHLWSGLGYYSRARNLHKAAKMIMEAFGGHFPDNIDDLQLLPGIGPSTAGAIASIAFNARATILDGNVKRVLSRIYGATTEKKLWEIAEKNTPTARVADYTQAIMDLGATLCTRTKPACHTCPFNKKCVAKNENLIAELPVKIIKKTLPTKEKTFLIFHFNGQIFLKKRAEKGIWGGLFCLPEVNNAPDLQHIQAYTKEHFSLKIASFCLHESFRHTFSHYHLQLHPVIISLKKIPPKLMEDETQIWYNPHATLNIGLPKPINTLLAEFYDTSHPMQKIKKRSPGIRKSTAPRPLRRTNLR